MQQFFLLIIALSCVFVPAAAADSEVGIIATGVSSVLENADLLTKHAAKMLSDGVDKERADLVTTEMYDRCVNGSNCGIINASGYIISVMPNSANSSVGLYIGDQEAVRQALDGSCPVLTPAFAAKEGFIGVEILQPVVSEDDTVNGAVALMMYPAEFLTGIMAPYEADQVTTVTVMQPDGYILYDTDPGQAGENLFSGEMFAAYDELLELGEQISDNREGNGRYSFSAGKEKETVEKEAWWTTVQLHDTEWRIILYRPVI